MPSLDVSSPPRAGSLTSVERTCCVGMAIGCMAVLLAAYAVPPDVRGHGTHERLGLPPCLIATFLHVPCPFCGMTTAYAWMAQGHPEQAFSTHPMGALGCIVTGLAIPSLLVVAATGVRPPALSCRVRGFCVAVLAVGFIVSWVRAFVLFQP